MNDSIILRPDFLFVNMWVSHRVTIVVSRAIILPMNTRDLAARIKPDATEELRTLIGMLGTGSWPAFPAGMERHFEIAKRKPVEFQDHPPALGLSIGGTNTKLIIASMKGGHLVAEHVVAIKNPAEPVHWEELFHTLLFEDDVVRSFLTHEKHPSIGVSFPMAVIDEIPFHRTKIPTIVDLVARDMPLRSSEYHFGRRFTKFLGMRNVAPCPLFYQGDGIVAHHGAVSLSDIDPDGKSTLLICGTGLATGDEHNYVQIGIAEILHDDPELYPPAETENRQFHYAVAGKGLFGLMRRALAIQARQSHSALAGIDLAGRFMQGDDSRLVVEVGTSRTLSQVRREALRKELDNPADAAWSEIVAIGEAIVERVIESIANALIATIVDMGRAANSRGHAVFFEGSIALNPVILPAVKNAVRARLRDDALWRSVAREVPLPPTYDVPLRRPDPGKGLRGETLDDIDMTLIGSVTQAMANDLLET